MDDPSDDIVQSGTKAAASNNGCSGLGWIEKYLLARTGDLETQRNFAARICFLRGKQHFIIKNAMTVVFESLRMPMTQGRQKLSFSQRLNRPLHADPYERQLVPGRKRKLRSSP